MPEPLRLPKSDELEEDLSGIGMPSLDEEFVINENIPSRTTRLEDGAGLGGDADNPEELKPRPEVTAEPEQPENDTRAARKACWLCKNYWKRLADGGPNCARLRANPLGEKVLKKALSLKILKCHPGTNIVDRFSRVALLHPGLPGEPLHCCCTGLMALVEKNLLDAYHSAKNRNALRFSIWGVRVDYCPACGLKIELDAVVKLRMQKLRDKRKASSVDGRSRPYKKRKKASSELASDKNSSISSDSVIPDS